MDDASFQKVGQTGKCLYGPRKLLLCGFPAEAQPTFSTLLGMLNVTNLPLVWCLPEDGAESVGGLMQRPGGSGAGAESTMPRAVIVGGISEEELHRLMSGCRQSGMQQALWAVVTPFSEQWTLDRLLAELTAERKALSGKKGPT